MKCSTKKTPKGETVFPIGTIVPTGEACSEWVVDVLGPLKPTSRNGKKYVVIFKPSGVLLEATFSVLSEAQGKTTPHYTEVRKQEYAAESVISLTLDAGKFPTGELILAVLPTFETSPRKPPERYRFFHHAEPMSR